MKILLIVSSYAPNTGGLQTVTQQLASALRERGHSLTVVANRYPRTLAASEVLDGGQVIRWHFLTPRLQQLLSLRFDLFLAGLLYLPLTLARLIFLLRQERPDVVNLHFVGAPALFVLIARSLMAFRLVVSLHGDDVEGLAQRARFDRWVFSSVLRRAETVTACSRYLLDTALGIEPSVKQNALVIHNGIDQPANASAVDITGGVFAAGRMVPKKGFDVLLRAHATDPTRSQLTLIGEGPERERLEQLARALGMNGEVRFRGNQDHAQVMEEMAVADVVAIPSLKEPFGLIALEAMSLGKPIVASRVGGLPEVLEGADALLVEPGNADELSVAIDGVRKRLRDDPKFGVRNRELARRFSTERMVDSYLQAYQG
jgi:glycosyltransferase involved in cell wall biosynthesis